MAEKFYEISDLDVGANFIEIELNNGDIEMKFLAIPIENIKKCLESFGIELDEESISDYEY